MQAVRFQRLLDAISLHFATNEGEDVGLLGVRDGVNGEEPFDVRVVRLVDDPIEVVVVGQEVSNDLSSHRQFSLASRAASDAAEGREGGHVKNFAVPSPWQVRGHG